MLSIALFGCGEPKTEDYIAAFKSGIDSTQFFVSEPEVTSEEIVGDSVKTSAKFRLTSLSDLYMEKGTLDNRTLITRTVIKDSIVDADVVFLGSKEGDNWTLRINDATYNTKIKGKPLSEFDKDTYIIEGSALEKNTRQRLFEEESKAFRTLIAGTFISKYPISCRNEYVQANKLIGGTIDYKLVIPETGNMALSKLIGAKRDYSTIVNSRIRYLGNKMFEVTELERSRPSSSSNWTTGDTWIAKLSDDKNSIQMQVKNNCANVLLERYINKDTDPLYAEARKKLRGKLKAGTYKSVNPITKNGEYEEANMLIGGTVKYQLTIPKNGDIFQSKVIGSKKSRYAVVDSKFIFDGDNTFYLKEMEKRRVGSHENWNTGDTWKVTLLEDNTLEMTIKGVNDTWKVTLAK
jgi:hypothetical protein